MVKSIWEFVLTGFGGIAGILYIYSELGLTSLGVSIILNILFILIIIWILLYIKDTYKLKELKESIPIVPKSAIDGKKRTMIIPGKTPSYKILINRTLSIDEDDPQIFRYRFNEGTKLVISINADKPVNFYLLDKWHVDRANSWYQFDTDYQDILNISEEKRTIPKNGEWFLVFEAQSDGTKAGIKVLQILNKK